MKNFDFSTYLSPLTWRYGSDEMRKIFSEKHKYELWRKIWIALAEAQHQAGLVSREELEDLKKNEKNIDIEKIFKLEKDTKHDVVAAIKEFAEIAFREVGIDIEWDGTGKSTVGKIRDFIDMPLSVPNSSFIFHLLNPVYLP